MTTELLYLTLTAGLAALLWIPQVLGIVAQNGMISAEDFRQATDKPVTGWAQRAKRVHLNMVENLAPFAVLVIAAHLSGQTSATTALWVQVFFWARLAHAAVLYAGIPYLRTLAFSAGFVAQIVIFLAIVF